MLPTPQPPSLTLPRRGLANIGNTCYLNSAIQALRYSRPFAEYFGSDAWLAHRHPDRKGHALAGELAKMLSELNAPAGGRMIIPSKFVREFIIFGNELNEEIRFGAQADAAEAIQILLDGLHMQQAREVCMTVRGDPTTPDMVEYIKGLESWASFFRKEYSPIVENFYGQTQTRITCTDCGEKSVRYEPWGVLKAPIPGADKVGAPAPVLRDCIAAAFSSETLDDYTCDKCNKRGSARIEHSISRLPQYLILSLKRFTNAGAKVRARIGYDPTNISLAEWRAWSSLQSASQAQYRLYATIEHLGTSHGGHYIMRARDGADWMVYDDGMCAPSAVGGDAAPDTYMLFLERF
jgi:ubiquitin C-terminal hydrolase